MIAKLTTYSKIFASMGWQSGQRGVVGVYVCAAALKLHDPRLHLLRLNSLVPKIL
ncbi:MAG: hypothetical protein FWH20_10575 [Oscillospiraceae bacterium]|nr:hypothetical protein [Oscillospiraceae bacterium]